MDDSNFSAAVLSKLPLADSVWRILQHTLADSWLADVWDRKRGRCYEQDLKFSTLARLIIDALTQHGGSGRAAFERGRELEQLPVEISSTYEKLGNLPLGLSAMMLKEGTLRLHELLPADPELEAFPLPACWRGFEVFAADGKAIKHVKRLLKPLRGLQAGILGARASVALNLRTGTAIGMVGHLDGEAGEAALTESLLPLMAEVAAGTPWLVVLDRLYCNLTFPSLVLQADGHFLIRYCSNTTFVADPTRAARENRDAQGQQIVQQWGRLGKTAGEQALYVRRITLHLANGTEISVITDLLDEATFPAELLLATYGKRWGIERVFQQITEVFSLSHLIGTSPQAVLYQLSMCLLIYNALQILRVHLAVHQRCAAEKISNEKLFEDLQRQLISVSELVTHSCLLELLGERPIAVELRRYLSDRLRDAWSDRWWKSPSSRGGGHKKTKTRVLGNHTSTYRVLQQAKT